MPEVLKGLVAGRLPITIAGSAGIIFDAILAAGAFLLMAFRTPAGNPLERAGWALSAISVLVFVTVDSLAAGVLTRVAAIDGAGATLAGFKFLFDISFILGTICFAFGALAVLASEMKSKTPAIGKPLIWIGIILAGFGLAAGLLYFAGVGLPQVIGPFVGAESVIVGILGIQIARSSLKIS
jgi:hypothetical protein